MKKESKRPDIGVLFLDLRSMEEFLKDTPHGSRQTLRFTYEGFDEAAHEVVSNQSILGEQAGILPRDVEALMLAQERIKLIDEQLPAARKIVELLEDTRSVLDDQAQRLVNAMAQMVEARAKVDEDTELLARYDKLRAYRSSLGYKAAKTRRRNEAEQPENEEVNDELTQDLPEALPAPEQAR
jgi:predicted nuclease of restriction endonuclease-like RecB superfamily